MILTTWLRASIPVGTGVDENATLIVQVGVEDESLALLISFGGVGRTCCAEPEVVTSTTRMLGVIESYSHGHGFKRRADSCQASSLSDRQRERGSHKGCCSLEVPNAHSGQNPGRNLTRFLGSSKLSQRVPAALSFHYRRCHPVGIAGALQRAAGA